MDNTILQFENLKKGEQEKLPIVLEKLNEHISEINFFVFCYDGKSICAYGCKNQDMIIRYRYMAVGILYGMT